TVLSTSTKGLLQQVTLHPARCIPSQSSCAREACCSHSRFAKACARFLPTVWRHLQHLSLTDMPALRSLLHRWRTVLGTAIPRASCMKPIRRIASWDTPDALVLRILSSL